MDWEKRSAVKFQCNAQHDSGNFKRHKRFYYDPDLPKSCEQTSTKSYKATEQQYDGGHLVPANHPDYSLSVVLSRAIILMMIFTLGLMTLEHQIISGKQ